MRDTRLLLCALCLKYDTYNEILDAVERREELSDEEIAFAEHQQFITILDSNYPEKLRRLDLPPLVLFYDGDVNALELVDSNELVFLYGENRFNIPEERLVTILDDKTINIANRVRVWFFKERNNADRFYLAPKLASAIVCTKTYPVDTGSLFVRCSISAALAFNMDIYVVPTLERSFNNDLIKEGAYLIDCYEDIKIN